jgi:hypothetical protein
LKKKKVLIIRTTVAPVARNVSRHGRNETATLATALYIRPGPGIENNKVPLQFSRDQEF